MLKQCLLASAIAVASTAAAAQTTPTPTLEELAAQVRAQQAQIEALTVAAEKGPAAGTGGEWYNKTTLGGYGEAYFKRIDGLKDEFDAYRLVLFVGHQFSDKVRFHSELEVEHAYVKDNDTNTDTSCVVTDDGDGIIEVGEITCGTPSAKTSTSSGYVAVEQLFVEYDYTASHRAAAGQILVPVGMINETHEPDTYNGVFRPAVEREILPTTWFETGLKFSGEVLPGFSYDAMYSSGLKSATGSVKDGRQRGSKADGSDPASTLRLKYTGVPGLEVGATWHHQADMSQGVPSVAKEKLEADLYTAHVAWQQGRFGLRALVADWDLDRAALATADQKRADQEGWYVEPSFKVLPKLAVFARYSEWDAEAADNSSSQYQESVVGVNWYLHERAVVKADLQHRDNPDRTKVDEDGFNVGIGFSF